MMAEALGRWLREEMELPPSAAPSPAALRRLCSGPTAPVWDYVTRHVRNHRNAKKIRGNLRWYRHLQELEAAAGPPSRQGALSAAVARLRKELQDLGDAIADAQETAQRLEASLEAGQRRRWAELRRGAELRLLGAELNPAGLQPCQQGALKALPKRPGPSRAELSAILASGAEPEVLVSIKALCKAREAELRRPRPPRKPPEAPDWLEQAEAVLIGHSPGAVLWALEALANQSTRALLAGPAPPAEAPPTLRSLLQERWGAVGGVWGSLPPLLAQLAQLRGHLGTLGTRLERGMGTARTARPFLLRAALGAFRASLSRALQRLQKPQKAPNSPQNPPRRPQKPRKPRNWTQNPQNWTQKPQNSAPKSPKLDPKSPDLTPKFPDLTPKFPDSAPKFPDSAPKFPDLTPKSPDSTPKFPDLAPKFPDLAPKSPDLAPKSPDLTPKFPDLAPKSPDLAPKSPDLTPKFPDLDPKSPDLTPKSPDSAPKSPDLTPKFPDSAPKFPDFAPNSPLGRLRRRLRRGRGRVLQLQQRLRFLSAATRGRRAALRPLQEQVVGVARAGPGSAPPPLQGAWLRRRELLGEPRPPPEATPPLRGLGRQLGVAQQGALLARAAILRQQLRQGALRARRGAGPAPGAGPEPAPPLLPPEGVAELLAQLRLVSASCRQRIGEWPRLRELVSQWWAQPAQWALATPPGHAPFSHWLQRWRAAAHALQATPTPEETPPPEGEEPGAEAPPP